jgi:hypothetical protein
VELAELQDREVGDGTTSVVIVAAELLKVSFHFFFLPFYLHLFLQSHVYCVFLFIQLSKKLFIQSMYNALFILCVICVESK